MIMMVIGDAIQSAQEARRRAERREFWFGTCKECGGTGKWKDHDGNMRTCARCNGTGKVK